jgi:hypothetical protein
MTRAADSASIAETVEVMPGLLSSGARWTPDIGEETLQVLERMSDLDDAGKVKVQNEAVSILARCTPPNQPNARTTGLVLGQVQSGKTMSFTTVTALSRDNGYRVVIVVTGTTVPLFEQSAARLRRDLGLEQGNRRWKHIPCVPRTVINRAAISDALDEWRDPNVEARNRQSVLITVMKQHQNLEKLVAVLRTLPLADVPTLLIDDEADQASLNTKVRTNEESTTYDKLRELRDCLPRHTFLQYTATPQALLLISIINILSPAFAEMLLPGDQYTGGKDFFIDHRNLVREIPPSEVPTRRIPLTEPPDSLFYAMRLFFLGVAAGMDTSDGGNRSMLVHPSVTRAEHAQFHQWVLAAKDEWKEILGKSEADADRIDLIDEFRPAYEDLKQTAAALPAFDVLTTRLVFAIRRTQVEKVNAAPGRTPTIDWNHSYSFILVGGTAMDRGYTVRGLTVTYMPRGLGGGNADTVQQRGRFFGYKRSYLAFCRIYLETAVLAAFQDYVEHEQDVRGRLQVHRSSGRPLTDWPRSFILDRAMQPTRGNVIDIPYQRQRFGDDWFIAKAPHDSLDAVAANRTLVNELRQRLHSAFRPDQGNAKRTEHQKHLVAPEMPLAPLFEEFLAPFRFTRFQDSQNYVSLLLLLKTVLEQRPDVTVTIFLMSLGMPRERSVDQDDEIPTLFQGEAPVNPPSERGKVYPGDAEIKTELVISVQIHLLTVKRPGETIADVPTLAVWMPSAFARDLVTQPQGAVR